MRAIDERAIKAHADLRFRSEYDYALFEYYRSAKVIAFLERAGVAVRGRVLDAGCGGGGMPLSLAEEAGPVVGIDPINRFGDAGVRLGRERGLRRLHFALADGMALPFSNGAFDLVLSHAVIEHVADAPLYLRECARVLAPDGRVYLSTAPYLSFAGAHLPRLKIPVPLHLLFGRRIAFATFTFLARHATWMLKEPANENSFIKLARKRGDQARRPARAGHGVPAPRADRRRGPDDRPRGAARHRDDPPPAGVHRAGPEARRPGARYFHQQHGIRAGARSVPSSLSP